MARATQFCVGLDNKPGVLAKLCGSLKRAKVNIEAISVADNAECCWVRFIASPTAKAKAALVKAKYCFCTHRVLTVKAANKPGELERVATKLGKARININYVYASTGDGGKTMLVLSVDNLARAAKAVG
ncbi:MAG: hypothetical protein ACYTF1_21795 [Planctomycetota bacterium]|jgi:hypothetical protein